MIFSGQTQRFLLLGLLIIVIGVFVTAAIQVNSHSPGRVLTQAGRSVTDMVFSPNSRTLAVVASNGTIRSNGTYSENNLHVCDVPRQTETQEMSFTTADGNVETLAFSPDGKRLAGMGNGEITFATVRDDHGVARVTASEMTSAQGTLPTLNSGQLVFSFGGRLISFSKTEWDSWPITRAVWDTRSGKFISCEDIPAKSKGSDQEPCAFSEDGALAALAVPEEDVETINGVKETVAMGVSEVRVYDLRTERVIQTIPIKEANQIEGLALSPNHRWLAIAGDRGGCVVWDIKTGQPVRMMTGLHSNAEPFGLSVLLAFSPDSRRLATGQDNGKVKLYDMQTGLLQRVLGQQNEAIHLLLFSPDGRSLATCDMAGTVMLWNVAAR